MNTAMIIPIMRDGGHGKSYSNRLPFWSGSGIEVEEWTSTWPAPTIHDVLVPLVQAVLNEYNGSLDYDRVTIAGFSEGGGGAVVAALAYPDVFNTVVASSAIFLRNYTAAALAGERRLAADPSRKRRLQTIMISKGLTDQWPFEGYPSDMEQLPRIWDDNDVMKHYNVEIRLYKGVGHWTWFNDWVTWPSNYFSTWSDTCKPDQCVLSAKLDHLAKLSDEEAQGNEAEAEAGQQGAASLGQTLATDVASLEHTIATDVTSLEHTVGA
jgi:pimeloyl-ACP methyl ester carboxylesterase